MPSQAPSHLETGTSFAPDLGSYSWLCSMSVVFLRSKTGLQDSSLVLHWRSQVPREPAARRLFGLTDPLISNVFGATFGTRVVPVRTPGVPV